MRKIFALATATALAACAQGPEPITDYNAPYLSGKGSPVVAPVRPEPRPVTTQRRWAACPEFPDDCSSSLAAPFSTQEEVDVDGPITEDTRPDADAPTGPGNPEAPDEGPGDEGPTRPEPEPPVTEPEPPAPEPEPEPPETHEPPPPQECPA